MKGGINRSGKIGTNAQDIQDCLNKAIKKVENSAIQPDLFYQNCKRCGQSVLAATYPVETCPMCDPEFYKNIEGDR